MIQKTYNKMYQMNEMFLMCGKYTWIIQHRNTLQIICLLYKLYAYFINCKLSAFKSTIYGSKSIKEAMFSIALKVVHVCLEFIPSVKKCWTVWTLKKRCNSYRLSANLTSRFQQHERAAGTIAILTLFLFLFGINNSSWIQR